MAGRPITGDPALVRGVNQSILLRLLRERRPCSRSELADASGLNKATVSAVVERLIGNGLVREVGALASSGGRPAVLLDLDPTGGAVIGAELGVDYLNVVLTDFQGTVVWRQQRDLNRRRTPGAVIDALGDLVERAATDAERQSQVVLGLGLSVCGLVDLRAGTVVNSPNQGWVDVPIRAELTRRFPFPVVIDNDAKVAAIGEHLFGVARGIDDFVYVIGNAGLGAGIWSGGRMFRGDAGWAGEFGHMTIDIDGPACRCGNHGCWEVFASQRALIQRIERARGGANSEAARPGAATMTSVVDAARAGDPFVLDALEQTGSYLGIGMANVINVLNPSLVVFGGELSMAAEFLMPAIDREVSARSMRWPAAGAPVKVAAYGFDSCAVGGAAMVINDLFTPSHLNVTPPEWSLAAGTTGRNRPLQQPNPAGPAGLQKGMNGT